MSGISLCDWQVLSHDAAIIGFPNLLMYPFFKTYFGLRDLARARTCMCMDAPRFFENSDVKRLILSTVVNGYTQRQQPFLLHYCGLAVEFVGNFHSAAQFSCMS